MMDDGGEQPERRRASATGPWGTRARNGARAAGRRLRDQGLAFAKAIAGSPAALGLLAGALGLGVGIGSAVAAVDARDRVDRIEERIEGVETVTADVVGTADALANDLGELALAIDDLGAAIAAGDTDAAEAAAKRADEIASDVRRQSAILNGQADVLADLAEDGTADLGSVRSDLAGVAATLAGTNDAIAALGTDLVALDDALAAAEGDLGSVTDRVAEVESSLDATADALATTQSTVVALDERLAETESAVGQAQATADRATERLVASGTDMPSAEDKLSFITIDVPVDGDYLVTVSSRFVAYNPNGASGGSCRRTTRVDSQVIDDLAIGGNAPAGVSYQTTARITLAAGPVEFRTSHGANVPNATCTASAVTVSAVLVP